MRACRGSWLGCLQGVGGHPLTKIAMGTLGTSLVGGGLPNFGGARAVLRHLAVKIGSANKISNAHRVIYIV